MAVSADVIEEKAITVIPQTSVTISQKDLDIYREHFCKDATPAEWTIFKQKCALYGLNPMLNEIHLVARWYQGKQVYSAQVSITGLITLAERTGRYEGTSKAVYYDEELNQYPVWPISKGPYPYAVSIGVYKQGHREPYVATLCFHERAAYKKDSALMPQWKSQGIHMLVKCCLAAALRWEFAEACSGVYIHEEMHMADANAETIRVIPDAAESKNEALRETANRTAEENAAMRQQDLANIAKVCDEEFGSQKGPRVYSQARAYAIEKLNLGDVPDDLLPRNAVELMWSAVNNVIARKAKAS